ncbi:AEC family transporter [Agathobaculum hominis]|uniref:AEC family transporter n=1 Tax=Agathobaculum hominis TaxID=2763014 RepID=A0ABR7GLX9_9FIRM|nr:AEC family transporter [Agathobaculum hominis]MBC5695318.1 AEC family transporter [Agathobaculum hominis]
MITQILLQQTIIMFALMLLGLLLSRRGMITEQGSRDLSNVLLYAVIPCVILRSYMSEFSTEKLRAMGLSALIAVIAFAASIAVAYLTCGTRHRIENFAVAFGNAGFIGIPLVTAVFGPEAAFYVVSFSTFANLLQWTYGIVIISGKKETMNLRMVFVNPVFISMVIGIALFVLQPTLPTVVTGTIGYIADGNTVLAMIILGYYLSKVQLRGLFADVRLYLFSALRLLVVPAVTILVFLPFPFARGEITLITLIAAATPIASSTAIFAQKFDQDYRRAVSYVCLSTILSVATLPLVMLFAERLLS